MVDEALEHSRETRHLLNNHIQVTGIKLDGIDKKVMEQQTALAEKINEMKTALKWAGSLVVSLTMAVLGWALLQQVNANEAQKKDLEQQVRILQEQERARVASRAEILSRLPASAAEAPVAASGGR